MFDYVLRIKNWEDRKLTKEQWYKVIELLSNQKWSFPLTIDWEMIGFFNKMDVRVEKIQKDRDDTEWYNEYSKEYNQLKRKSESWTDAIVAWLSDDEKVEFTKMAYARYWKWRERVRWTPQQKSFDEYIKKYVRILIRWKRWYTDALNKYDSEHFLNWENELESPEILKS